MEKSRRQIVAASICVAVVLASCTGNDTTRAKSGPSSSTTTATGTGFEAPTSTGLGAVATTPSTTAAPDFSGGRPMTKGTEPKGTTATTAGGTTTTVPPGLPPEKCPDAKTCRRYGFKGDGSPARWPIGPNGRATIHYNVYPFGSRTSLSVDQITQAIAAAFATWQRAAPALEFVYDGIASKPPTDADGVNTVGFGTGVFTGTATDSGHITESDIYLGASPYVWHPCEQRDDSCTPANDGGELDLEAITTHEAGHLLWLRDMTDETLERELTMHPGTGAQLTSTDRFWNTLALGDVLGIRALYPCSCPLPPIYSP